MRYLAAAIVIAVVATAGCAKKEAAKTAAPAPEPKTSAPFAVKPRQPAGPPSTSAGSVVPHHEVTTTKGQTKQPEAKAGKALGLNTYPGAKLAVGPDAILRTAKGNREMVQADFKTSDQAGAVHDFYMKQLATIDQEWIKGQAAYVAGKTATGALVVVTAVADAVNVGQTQVRVVVTRARKKG